MLMNIKCDAVTSIDVHLTFDDRSTKDANIGVGDLIEVDFNKNGLRNHVQGVVLKINTPSADQKTWSIIVDGSDDFKSEQFRFSPLSILDIEIIRKRDAARFIETPRDITGILGLRIIKGHLQYTQDGFNWYFVDKHRPHIKDEEGTAVCMSELDAEDCIKDEIID